MVTEITMIPELNLGIIVLTNQQEGGAFSSISNQIKDGYLGKTGIDWVSLLSARRKKSLDEAKTVTESVWQNIDVVQRSADNKRVSDPFVGKYTDPWLGEAFISIKDGKLRFDSKRSPKLTGEMLPYKGNTFVVKWDDRAWTRMRTQTLPSIRKENRRVSRCRQFRL
jgi:Domain of unknown function (DUF3471).